MTVEIKWAGSEVDDSSIYEGTRYTCLGYGEDMLLMLNTETGRIVNLNLRNGALTCKDELSTYIQGLYRPFAVNPSIVSQNNLAFTIVYVKSTEAEGSRNIYARRVKIDPVSCSVLSLGDEKQFTNVTVDESLTLVGFCGYYMLSDSVIIIGEKIENSLILLDLSSFKAHKYSGYANPEYVSPLTIMKDRTSGKLVLVAGQHWWTVPGSVLILINPYDFTELKVNTSFDSGSGAFLRHMCYITSDEKVKDIFYGASGGYPYYQHASKWNCLYLDDGDLHQEFVVEAGAAYSTANNGNRIPIPLGIDDEGKIWLMVYASLHGTEYGSTQAGASIMKVDDMLGNPDSKQEVKIDYTGSGNACCIHCYPNTTFLSEFDWCYYHPVGFFPINGVPMSRIAKVSGVPDLIGDPYNVSLVSSSGLVPAKLELKASLT